MLEEFRRKTFHSAPQQHRRERHAQNIGEFAPLAQQLERHIVQDSVFLLGENPDFTFFSFHFQISLG